MNAKSIHTRIKWVACLAACLPFAAANAVPQYSVSDLGGLGGTYSQGLGVNNSGLASGFSYLPDNASEHAIVGQDPVLPQDLGTLGGSYSQAYGINNLNQVVGAASLLGDTFYHAFQSQGGVASLLSPIKDLSVLVNPGYSRAFSINDNGQATGFSSTSSGTEHAVIWENNGAITDLGTLDGTGNSQGVAINLSGQVAGLSTLTGNKAPHAVLWANGTKLDLGTLGGTHSAAYAINANSEVTGSATLALDAAQHAFLWQPNQVPPMKDLGTLGGNFSEGYGISTAGDVVGYSTTANDAAQKAFLWQLGIGLQDLNALIDPASGWTLLEAHAISDDGTYITGIGTFSGQRHAFLLKRQVTDTTPPVVNVQITPAAPTASGWYLSAPSIVWSISDPESAIASKVGCTDMPSVANTAPAGQSFSCSATSAGGSTGPVTTPAIKVDTTLPVFVDVPAAFTQAATGLDGAVVNYTAPAASDTFSGISPAGVSCAPASGSIFPLGPTSVNCSVRDNAGNSSNAGFAVTVADQTPPVITANVTGTAGQNGWFIGAVSVAWNVADDQSALTSTTGCATANITLNGTGQVFTCTATSAGGTATASTQSINIDTQAPSFPSCPASVTLTQGQALAQPTATDNLTTPIVTGAPASLPLGTTTVNWTATDQAGLSASCVQQVTVTAPISETIATTKSQCKRINATSGEWLVQGSSTISTNNSIQLYSTATVPVDLTGNKLGAAAPVAKGAWQFQAKPGPACTTPISLRSTAAGKVLER
ncbi:MAG: HYR domain-containing protein, partial [Methylobacter sp.]